MSDPLDALRAPVEPVDPDPDFAARLRERLRDAVLTEGEAMTQTTAVADLAWGPSLVPYLAVADARRALDWYAEVFGAVRRGEPYVQPDGSIGHAEVGIGDSVLMLSEGVPDVPVGPPQPGAAHSHSIVVEVADTDDTVRRARDLGASVEREPVDEPYGRIAVVVDPFGHRWLLTRRPGRAAKERAGEIAYVSMGVPDDERARAFYGAVLGWQFTPGSVPRGWHVTGVRPRAGLWGSPGDPPAVELCYRVGEVAAAVELVRSHGGQAGEPERTPYGLLAHCTDDQGIHFQLWQPVD
jgi:uncharacterized glyoxalase superfamily protein PhnB